MNFLGFCYSIYSKKGVISSDSQRLIEIVLKWNFKLFTKFHTGKTILENLTGELDAWVTRSFAR